MSTGGAELEAFEVWLRSWGAADDTIARRCGVIRFAVATRWPCPAAEITSAQLAVWLGQDHLAPWTRLTYYGHIRSYFGWMAGSGLRGDDPTTELRRPKHPANVPKPWTPDEVARIYGAASGDVHAWTVLAHREGLRAHEIAKIDGRDVRPENLFVCGKGSKEVFLPTHPDVWALAETYPRVGPWFPGLTSPAVSSRFGSFTTRLGIYGSIHRGRHTFATELLRAGVNIRVVQRLMRHASLATTEAYLDATDDEMRSAINRLAA